MLKKIVPTLLLFFALISSALADSAPSHIVDASSLNLDKLSLKTIFKIYDEPYKQTQNPPTIEQIISSLDNSSTLNKTHSNITWKESNQFTSTPFKLVPTWFYFEINNPTDTSTELLLLSENALIHKIEFFLVKDNKIAKQYTTGSTLARGTRPIQHRYFLFPISIEAKSSVKILTRVTGRKKSFLNKTYLVKEDKTVHQDIASGIFFWYFMGSLVLYLVLCLGLFYASKELNFLILAAYITSTMTGYMMISGYFGFFINPKNPSMQLSLELLSICSTMIFSLLFANNFLTLKDHSKKLYYSNNVAITSLVLVFVSYLLTGNINTASIASPLILAIGLLHIANWLVSLRLWKRGVVNAKYYATSWFAYVFLLIIAILSELVIIQINVRSDNLLMLGNGLLILFLFISLILKVKNSLIESNQLKLKHKAKDIFLSRLSHEIRTPISGVLGMSQLLKDSELNEEQEKYNNFISIAGNDLLNIVNEVLDYSKIEADQLSLEETSFNVKELCYELGFLYEARAQGKGLHFELNIDHETPIQIKADPSQLKQILNNLLGNALKFTKEGFIGFSTSVNEDKSLLTVTIIDSGIGIHPDKLKIIFDEYAQADDSTTRNFGGTGLGLTIAKQTVLKMGGEMWAEHSKRTKTGSVFIFTIPLSLHTHSSEE